MLLPLLVEVVGHAVINPLSTLRVRKDLHWSGASSVLAEGALQHIGDPNLLPQLSREGVVVQQVVEVLFQAAQRVTERSLWTLGVCFLSGGSKSPMKQLVLWHTSCSIADVSGSRGCG